MARMKKGEAGHERAANLWKETMLKRFGSEEALHQHMRSMGRKGGMHGGTGGFAANPQLAKEAGRKGGKAHAGRGRNKDYNYEAIWQKHGSEIVMRYKDRDASAEELAKEYGIPASSLRYRIRRDSW